MEAIDQNAAIAQIFTRLKEEFGPLVRLESMKGVPQVTVNFPGGRFPVVVYPVQGGDELHIRICGPVCRHADWSPGLLEFLLTETSQMLVGNITRRLNGIAIEHTIPIGADQDVVSSTVRGIAQSSSNLHLDLAMMGALTTPEAASASQ